MFQVIYERLLADLSRATILPGVQAPRKVPRCEVCSITRDEYLQKC
jgi:hypothetical protein